MHEQKSFSGSGFIKFLSFFFHLFYYIFIAVTIITTILLGYSLLQLGDPSGFPAPMSFQVFFYMEDGLGIAHWGTGETSMFSIDYAMGTAKLPNVPYSFMAIFCLMAIN